MSSELTIWTIGHSTRPLDDFLALLAQYRIEAVADVRRFPGSRRCPQYGQHRVASQSRATPARISLAARARRAPPAGSGFAQHGLAQYQFPRLRRPYADGGIRRRARPIAGSGAALAHDPDVHGIRVVALSPFDDRRCPARPRHRRGAYPRCGAQHLAPLDRACPHRGGPADLRAADNDAPLH